MVRSSAIVRPVLAFILVWTLALLLLGSIVHAPESSLACPDWPTCFGTMMPEMTGGVFWEHLHRLWAGALVVFFAVAVVLIRRRLPERGDLFRMGLAGLGLLVFQSVLGGLTVIYRLPDAISTSHLALAFVFLALLTTMLARVGPSGRGDRDRARLDAVDQSESEGDELAARTRFATRAGVAAAVLVFLQSIVGALVRHTDSGMACPDVPLCLGRLIPPLEYPAVQLHFLHRVLGVLVAGGLCYLAWRIARRESATGRAVSATGPAMADPTARRLALMMGLGAMVQVLVGFLSVAYRLAVPLVSVHTLLAAILLSLAVTLAARRPAPTST